VPETNASTTAVDAGEHDATGVGGTAVGGVDVQKLADKVYQLFLADARRGGARPELRTLFARRTEDL